jgi:hypothetical protein
MAAKIACERASTLMLRQDYLHRFQRHWDVNSWWYGLNGFSKIYYFHIEHEKDIREAFGLNGW